ncbi:MAG: hypothetical protein Q7T20_07870 [Saprospiraceae bacterium]|nr:hypothetical protein [Saprospiraceae bacterium]
MKNLLFSSLAFSLLLISLGCPKPALPAVQFSFDQPFSLQVGQTGDSSDIQGFTIKFEKVAADSRCPQGVECITAGKADVVLTLTKAGESQTVTLPFTMTYGTSNVTDFKGHTLRVLGVSPIKIKDKEIKPEEYNIMLSVAVTPPATPKAKLDEPFTLKVGETIVLEENPERSIRFDSVSGDSRCAEGVQCIWAGRADCVFTLTNGSLTEQVTLATGDMSQGGKGESQLGTYTLKLKDVAPPKKQGPPIPQKDYKATLVLVR